MWNDDEQLEEELNWTPTRRNSMLRAPRGGIAILAMGGVLMLSMWGVTMKIVGSASELRAVGVFLLMGLEGLVALSIARVLWRAMGPVARGILRPFMLLGPLPPLAVLCCMGIGLFHELTPEVGFTTRGKNWGIPYRGSSVPFKEVQALCAKQGPPWRVPREDEVARLQPLPSEQRSSTSRNYWLLPGPGANGGEAALLDVTCQGPRCSTHVRREWAHRDNKAIALCVDF